MTCRALWVLALVMPPARVPAGQRTGPALVQISRQQIIQLLELGKLPEAEALIRKAMRLVPRDAGLYSLLGIVLKRRGRGAEALAAYQRGLLLAPAESGCLHNLANLHRDSRRPDEAVLWFRRTAALRPDDAQAARLFGAALRSTRRLDDAVQVLDAGAGLPTTPGEGTLLALERALVHFDLDRPESCLAITQQGLEVQPGHRGLRTVKAMAERRLGQFAEALATYRSLLTEQPSDPDSWRLMGNLLAYSIGDLEQGVRAYRHALALQPGDIDTAARLCDNLMNGRYAAEGALIDEAHGIATALVGKVRITADLADRLQSAFLRTADYEELRKLGDPQALTEAWARAGNVSALHMQLSRAATPADRRHLVAMHRLWGEAQEREQRPVLARPLPLGGRRLRVGLLSSDLRDHPVGYFVQPIIEHFDREQFEFYCYSASPRPADRIQNWFASTATQYRLLTNLSDADAAATIAADQLDILIELAGSTRYNRMRVLSHRPAPMQASWLGYPHSLGLPSIDRILVDPYLLPPDPALLLEKPLILPEAWVTVGRAGFGDGAITEGLPEERAGHLTFGTMNNPYKYTAETLALWAAVLRETPGSRFLFVRPEGGSAVFRRHVRALFEGQGVDPTRVEFEAVRGRHMPHYNRIDIALDTAPQTGGTTTCETLWMGVPTVTLVGEALFERLSYSMLSNAGLGDLCAFDRDSYVALARGLAADQGRRRALRHGLREQIQTHPLGDKVRWVRNFEKTIRDAVG